VCEEPLAETLFGPDRIDRDGDAKTGDLIFLDAYPAGLPPLEVDIINCHHSNYYAGGSQFPSETEDPVPVYFLTVAAGTQWIFRLLSRSGEHAARGTALLRSGLRELGAGAKTAVGYGSFAV
jgi:CRISPR-associated protein Cmr6